MPLIFRKEFAMRLFRIGLALAALSLAACQPQASDPNYNVNNTGAIPANEVAVNDNCGITSNTLADEKALFAAETAYNVPADAYVRLMTTLPAETRAKVRPLLIEAYKYLKLARTAYNAGDGCSLKQYSDLAKSLGDQAKAILPQ
jgi:hypothetical protein